jgi:transcriptional regulator with XRE-family HTH domain
MRINGDALRAIRERTGLTISELSRASGVDRTVITRIETGQRQGTPAQHKALAEALHVSMLAIAVTYVVA